MNITREHLAGLELADQKTGHAIPVLAELIKQALAAPVAEAVAYIRETDLTRLSQPHVSGCAASLSKRPGDGWLGIYTHTHDAELVELVREAKQHHGVMLMTDPPQEAWKYHRMDDRIDAKLSTLPRT